MITISKEQILSRVAAISAAEHYYSRAASGADAYGAGRAPLFHISRNPLVSLWVEDACCDMTGRLAGWTRYAGYEDDELCIALRDGHASREPLIRPCVESIIALDVWTRMAAATAPEVALRAMNRIDDTMHRMLCLLA